MGNSRIIIGWIFVVLGILILASYAVAGIKSLFWFYGIPSIILGVIILLNKKEDEIEKIRKK